MPFRALPAILTLSLVALSLQGCRRSSGKLRTQERAFTYTAQLAPEQTLRLLNPRGSITVEPSADDTLRVSADFSWRGSARTPRGLSASAAATADGILVCALFGDDRCSVSDDGSTQQRLNVRLGGARDVKVNFTVQVPAGVKLDLVGVDTRITSASTAPVKARTMNGNVTVVTAVGPVRAVTMNGSVDARMTTIAGSDSVIASTMNGDAWAFLPESANATVDLAVTNGAASTDFSSLTVAARTIRGTLGSGEVPVRIRTMNGAAGIGRLDAEGRSALRP